MQEIIEAVKVVWPIFLAIIALTVWLVRLENKAASARLHSKSNFDSIVSYKRENREELDKLWVEVKSSQTKMQTLETEIMKSISDVKQTLARIEGSLGFHIRGQDEKNP